MKQLLYALKLIGGLNYILIGIFQMEEIKFKSKKYPLYQEGPSPYLENVTLLLDTVGCHPDVYYPLVSVYHFVSGRSE